MFQERKEALEEKELESYFTALSQALLNPIPSNSSLSLPQFLHSISCDLLGSDMFEMLPEEVIWNCLGYLHIVDIVRVGQVSKRASRACESQVLWELLLVRDFDVMGNPNIDGDGRPNVVYCSIYKQMTRTRKQRVERLMIRQRKSSEQKAARAESW
jgi:hypothetical protein